MRRAEIAQRREWVERVGRLAFHHQLVDDTIRLRALSLEQEGLKALDALHVACAEAAEILLRNLTPSRLARFWAAWQAGQGDYLRWRDEIFGHYDVSKLYEEVLAYQTASANHAQAT